MPTIKESFSLVASNADILSAPSRLAAVPSNGVLTIEVSSTDSDATNFGTITLQLPNGDIPFEDLIVPIGFSATDNSMDTDLQLLFSMPVSQGGHVLLSYTENGTVVGLYLLVTLVF